MTDTAQERVEDWTDAELAAGLTEASLKVQDIWGDRDLFDAVREAARRLRARQREEGDGCTCPRWAEQHGWDSECPRHGYDWERACDYEDHVPGDSSYGRTGRGGIMVRCQKCEAPLEIHPDDGNKYTERWHGEAATPQREDGDGQPCVRCGRTAVAHHLCERCMELHREAKREGEREPAYVADPETMGSVSPMVWVPGQAMYQKWLHDVGDTREKMVPLYTEPPAERERDEALERAFREHEKTIRAMSEHLCDHTRLSMGGTKWICTRPPNHGGRHAWRPKPRPAEPPADTEEGAES